MIEGLYLHNTHMISNYNLSPHIIKYHNRWAYITCLIILLVVKGIILVVYYNTNSYSQQQLFNLPQKKANKI